MMDKEDKDTIKHISETIDKIHIILQQPQNRAARIFELVATGVGILSILSIIDLIKSWSGG